jgi:hypothetical protein
MAALHLDLVRWSAAHDLPVLASRLGFERALRAEGFAVTTDGGLCYGLLLREDWAAHEYFQAVPEPAGAEAEER